MKGKGLVFSTTDILRYGMKVKMFGGKEGVIIGSYVNFTQTLFVKGKRQNVCYKSALVSEIVSDIRRVFDASRVTIATRSNKNEPLLSTGKGMGKPFTVPTEAMIYDELTHQKLV